MAEQAEKTVASDSKYTREALMASKKYRQQCDILAIVLEEEKEYTFSGKRIKRGLYRSKEGILMNADINGASNIIRKVYPCKPKLKERWYRGTVNVPVMCI